MASVDNIEDNTAFAAKNQAKFPIISDANKTVAKAYGVMSVLGFAKRWTYYIDPQGLVVMIDKDINPATAGRDIVKNLGTLGVEKR